MTSSATRAILATLLVLSLVLPHHATRSQTETPPPNDAEEPVLQTSLAAGMGVNYLNAQDLVDLVNSSAARNGRASAFKGAVEFFGSVSLPVSEDWVVKAEYAYLLGGYSVESGYGVGEFTFSAHQPTLVLQYVAMLHPRYNVKVGAGGGYYVGALSRTLGGVEAGYSGSGPGALLDVEGNTALGESLYAYIGAFLRWSFIGELTDDQGRGPSAVPGAPATTLHYFGLGFRLGFTWYL